MPYADPEADRQYKRAYYRQRGIDDPQYHIRNNQAWRAKNPRAYMLSRRRNDANNAGIPFSITVDDIVIPEFCPVFPHIKLEFGFGRKSRPDCTPTLDRLIPSLGYVPGNVRVISMRANRLKSDASAAELRRIADWIEGELVDFDPLDAVLG